MAIAPRLGAEIVSIDSATIYRGMDIATAKPTSDQMRLVPHHMIDIVEPTQTVTVAEFQRSARLCITEIIARGALPLLCGGSGLFLRAVVDPLRFPGTDQTVRDALELEARERGGPALHDRLRQLDAEAASRIDAENTRRIVRALEVIATTGRKFSEFRDEWGAYESIYDLSIVGLRVERDELDRRIDARVDGYVADGLLDEVKTLEAAGVRRSTTSVQALGYAQVLAYLDGRITFEEAVDEIKRRTRKFARRQCTWFNQDPRVRWFDDSDSAGTWLMERTSD